LEYGEYSVCDQDIPSVLTYLWISAQGINDPWPDGLTLKRTIDAFTARLRVLGINAADCLAGQHIYVSPGNQEAAIDQAIHQFCHSTVRAPPKLILVIIAGIDTVFYNRIKYICDVKEEFLNVCVLAPKFANANSQYFSNVALKINLRLGGRNQSLDNSKLGIIAQGKTMIVGIDVTHPSPGSTSNAPSVASIVASVDQWLGQWPGDLRIQTGRQEMVADIEGLFKSRLHLWCSKQVVYPETSSSTVTGSQKANTTQFSTLNFLPSESLQRTLLGHLDQTRPPQGHNGHCRQAPQHALLLVQKQTTSTTPATHKTAQSLTAASPNPETETSTYRPTPRSKEPPVPHTSTSSTTRYSRRRSRRPRSPTRPTCSRT
jgi:hypothetical protein